MKITIDTKEDSKEEIKKVISLLHNILNESTESIHTNIFEDKNESPKTEGLLNLFNSEKAESSFETPKTVTKTADDLLKESNNIEVSEMQSISDDDQKFSKKISDKKEIKKDLKLEPY